MTVISKSFAKRAMMVLAVLFTAMTADATEFITDVKLIGYKNKTQFDNLQDKLEKEGWTAINKDLNADAGGDYIHLLYKSEANTDGLNHGYITDFFILGSKSGSFDEEITFEGRTYHLVSFEGSTEFENSNGDLNRGAGGDYIHLYYTKDPMNEQAVSEIVFDNSESGALGNQGGSTAYDLNNKAGGKYIYMHLTKKNATTVKYISYTYDTTNGLQSETKICGKFNLLTSNDKSWASGWYVVSGNVEISDRITVSGTVNLILLDGCTLEAKKGIELTKGNTLNIYAQSEGANAGKLKAIATNEEKCAGIGGGEYKPCGTVTIYGGTVEARGGVHGAGIGGGFNGDGGTVTIYGGTVEARGGRHGAGIGLGLRGSGGTVTIYGGTVEAHGGESGAGIGVGFNGAGGDVTIYGGTVEAHGGMNAAGLGGGYACNGITVSIYGGKVVAYGDYLSTGIGAGRLSDSHGTLKIGDGVKVYGGNSKNPTTVIATGPQENVGSRPRYMIVQDYLFGDANDDDKVNAADLVEMVNAKDNKASTRFVLKNADIDGSGNITKSDIDAVEKIIMQK